MAMLHAYLAPDMGGMLVDESLCRIAKEKFGDNQKPNVLFTIQRLLEDVASIAVSCEVYDATSFQEVRCKITTLRYMRTSCSERFSCAQTDLTPLPSNVERPNYQS